MKKAMLVLVFVFLFVFVFLKEEETCCVSPIPEQRAVFTPLPTPTLTPTLTPTPRVAKVTAYSCGGLKTDKEIRMNCPSLLSGKPKTATGTIPVPKKTVACDRKNLGKAFLLEGIGRVVCEDTGGAIKGDDRFDLYLETVEEAKLWGVRYISFLEEDRTRTAIAN